MRVNLQNNFFSFHMWKEVYPFSFWSRLSFVAPWLQFSFLKCRNLPLGTKEFFLLYIKPTTQSNVCWQMVHFPSFFKGSWNEEKVFMNNLEKMSQNSSSKNFTGIFLKLQSMILYLCANSKRKHHDYKLLKLVFQQSHGLWIWEFE